MSAGGFGDACAPTEELVALVAACKDKVNTFYSCGLERHNHRVHRDLSCSRHCPPSNCSHVLSLLAVAVVCLRLWPE